MRYIVPSVGLLVLAAPMGLSSCASGELVRTYLAGGCGLTVGSYPSGPAFATEQRRRHHHRARQPGHPAFIAHRHVIAFRPPPCTAKPTSCSRRRGLESVQDPTSGSALQGVRSCRRLPTRTRRRDRLIARTVADRTGLSSTHRALLRRPWRSSAGCTGHDAVTRCRRSTSRAVVLPGVAHRTDRSPATAL